MRFKFLSFLVAAILLIVAANPAWAALDVRALGMGGACVAVTDSANAVDVNPAALTQLSGPQLQFSYGQGFLPNAVMMPPFMLSPAAPWTVDGDGNASSSLMPALAFGSPVSETGLAYGLSVSRYQMYTHETISFGFFDIPPTVGDETELTYALGYEIIPNLSVGAAVRVGQYSTFRPMITKDEEGNEILVNGKYSLLHVSFDAGVLYKPVPQFAAGIAIRDLNQPEVFFPDESTSPQLVISVTYPYQLRWGVAFHLPPFLTVAWDMTGAPDQFSDFLSVSELGAEIRLNKLFAVRGGLYHGTFTLGAGLKFPFAASTGLNFDYAFVGGESAQHYFSASFLF